MRPYSRLTAHQSKKFQARQKMRSISVLILILVSIISWTFTLSRLSMLSIFSIDFIKVNGIEIPIAQELQTASLNALTGNYLGLFSKSNIFLYPRKKIIALSRNVSPEVESVKVVRNGLNTLDITINEKIPTTIICADYPDFSSDITDEIDPLCYSADNKGYIFKKFDEVSVKNYHRYYIPSLASSISSTTEGIVGKYATSTELYLALENFYNKAVLADIPVLAILVNDNGEYELYAKNPVLKSEKNLNSENTILVVYFDESRPLEDQLVNLITFWKKMNSDAKAKGENIGFEYINVKYGSNVFYRKIQ